MDGSVLAENHLKMLGLTFPSKLDWNSCIPYLAKTASKKIGALIRSPEVALYLYKYTIRPCVAYCCDAVAMSGLVLLVTTWNFWIRYKNSYAGLLALDCWLS